MLASLSGKNAKSMLIECLAFSNASPCRVGVLFPVLAMRQLPVEKLIVRSKENQITLS